jgi:thiol-disulfide isomerase/thioredoxin
MKPLAVPSSNDCSSRATVTSPRALEGRLGKALPCALSFWPEASGTVLRRGIREGAWRLVAWATVFLFLLPLSAEAQAEARAHGAPQELALRDLAGEERRLEEYRGKVVVLNFWATWCVPCREEMPMLERVAQQYAARGVVIVGASADAPETQEKIAPFVAELALTFPIWTGATTEHMQAFELGTALPATVLLDRDGRIAFRILGPLDEHELTERIEWLLADAAARGPKPEATLDTFTRAQAEHEDHAGHDHAKEEDHAHGGIGMEGASLVPS